MNRWGGRYQGSALTGGTWSWRLAGVLLVGVAVVVTAIGTCMVVTEREPRQPTVVRVHNPRPTPVAMGASLTRGFYSYESPIPGEFLFFWVPEGLELTADREGGPGSGLWGLVLFTPDGRSWMCLRVGRPPECGREVAPDADGIAELFDLLLNSVRLDFHAP